MQKLKSTNQAKNIEKFILISSFGVTRPWFPVTIILNAIVGMIMKWKLYGENELRESGIPYLIIRPPGTYSLYIKFTTKRFDKQTWRKTN